MIKEEKIIGNEIFESKIISDSDLEQVSGGMINSNQIIEGKIRATHSFGLASTGHKNFEQNVAVSTVYEK